MLIKKVFQSFQVDYLCSKFADYFKMKILAGLLFITTLLCISGCSSDIPDTDPVFDDSISMKKRLKMAMDEELIVAMGFDEKFAEQLDFYYKTRDYRPVWTNDSMITERGTKFLDLIQNENAIGLPKHRLATNKKEKIDKELIVRELQMTAQFSQMVNDLKVGIMDTSVNKMRPKLPAPDQDFVQRIKEFDGIRHLDTWIASMGPQIPYYRDLARALFNHVYQKEISTKSFTIPTIKDDTIKANELSREALIEKGYIAENSDQEAFEEGLKKFQLDHALKDDAVLGKYTVELLGESEQHQIDRTVLSLERWRWRSIFPDRYIWINIPEYKLRLFYNDTMQSEHRVVVGKPENTTPQLTSSLRNIISMPFWTQPHSIATKEFLPAQQANSNYAARHHYKVYRGGAEVDPSTINWKRYKETNFPFKVMQDPGNDNALGLIKFEFNNKYGVYVHDTPSKSFFNRDVRSYSHGCVRCDMPDSLAHFILRRDEKQKFLPDSLDSAIVRKEHMTIALHKPITIQIDYITVSTTPEGNLCVHPDVYKRDEAYLKWMKG